MVKKNSEFCYYHAKEGVTRRNRPKEGKITQIDFFLPYPLIQKKRTTTENVLRVTAYPLPKSISDFQDQLDPGE